MLGPWKPLGRAFEGFPGKQQANHVDAHGGQGIHQGEVGKGHKGRHLAVAGDIDATQDHFAVLCVQKAIGKPQLYKTYTTERIQNLSLGFIDEIALPMDSTMIWTARND